MRDDIEMTVSPARRLWHHMPKSIRQVANSAYMTGAQQIGQFRGALERGGAGSEPICVMGLHRSVLGLGRGARLFQAALDDAGMTTTAWDVSQMFSKDMTIAPPSSRLGQATTVVAHLNPIEHLHALAVAPNPRPKKGFRVGYWAWETTQVPPEWLSGVAAVDEIWCPSHFTAQAVKALVGRRRIVRVVAHPVSSVMTGVANKQRFGLSPDKITIFTACDLQSSIARKNPFGAIEAFKRSRCGERGAAELLVKVHGNFDTSLIAERELMAVAAAVPGVRIMNARLDTTDMKALRSSVDIVFSPHRSEGFGLILAEAMMVGKPVIATGWSGNMDFMDGRSAALIHAKVVPVEDPSGAYRYGNWAEPDLDHAAVLIDKLVYDPVERARLGDAGAAKISAYADRDAWNSRVRRLLLPQY